MFYFMHHNREELTRVQLTWEVSLDERQQNL